MGMNIFGSGGGGGGSGGAGAGGDSSAVVQAVSDSSDAIVISDEQTRNAIVNAFGVSDQVLIDALNSNIVAIESNRVSTAQAISDLNDSNLTSFINLQGSIVAAIEQSTDATGLNAISVSGAVDLARFDILDKLTLTSQNIIDNDANIAIQNAQYFSDLGDRIEISDQSIIQAIQVASETIPYSVSDVSGFTGNAGVAQDVFFEDFARTSATIQNIGAGDLWVKECNPIDPSDEAGVGIPGSFKLAPGAHWDFASNNRISIISAAATAPFTAKFSTNDLGPGLI